MSAQKPNVTPPDAAVSVKPTEIEGVPVEIFRTGDYGPKGTYSEADLDEIAASLDPSYHTPVISLHHDDKQGPHGEVAAIERRGASLFATFKNVSKSFKEWLGERPYAARSVEIYPRAATPAGKLMLRAVSFVSVPEVKGLARIAAGEEGGEALAFKDERGEYFAFPAFAELRCLRTDHAMDHCHEAMLDASGNGKTGGPKRDAGGMQTIDTKGHTHEVAAYMVAPASAGKGAAGAGLHSHGMYVEFPPAMGAGMGASIESYSERGATKMSETVNKDAAVGDGGLPGEVEALKGAMETERKQFAETVAGYTARLSQLERENARKDFDGALRELVGKGAPPAVLNKPGLFEFAESLRVAGAAAVVKFGEGEKAVATTGHAYFMELLGSLAGLGPVAASGAKAFDANTLPAATGDDPTGAALHARALKFMEADPKLEYVTALKQASRR